MADANDIKNFDPVLQLKELLGPKPKHPWGALIPQLLIWSFRRFCVMKLTSVDVTSLADELWSDHLELVYLYAPKGLETIAKDWFAPHIIDHVHSDLSDYNRFFIDCLVVIDEAVASDDENMQQVISDFLDFGVAELIRDWLGDELKEFLIYPMNEEEDDVFRDTRFHALIDSIVAFSQKVAAPPPPETVAPPLPEPVAPPPPETVAPPLPEPVAPPLPESPEPPAAATTVATAPEPAAPEPVVPPPGQPQLTPAQATSIAAAAMAAARNRHRTLRASRSTLAPSRGKTRKLHSRA